MGLGLENKTASEDEDSLAEPNNTMTTVAGGSIYGILPSVDRAAPLPTHF